MMTLIKHISDKLIYCYYKYAITGLLIIPNNLLINSQKNDDIKFNHFLTAFSLSCSAIKNKQQNISYVDGIDSKYFINSKRPYPPEAQLGVYTEAIDVYMLSHIVYGLFRHSLNPSDN